MNDVFLPDYMQKQETKHSIRHYNEIDIVKGIGIICIVSGHVFPMSMLNQFLFSFHVPLFFLISGFTYRCYKNKKAFYGNKLQRLIFPYLFFSLISILLMWVMDKLIPLDVDTRILPNIAGMLFANSNSGYMTWNNPLWFLPCIFVSLALMDLLESVLMRTKWENSMVARLALMIVLWHVGILVNTRFSVHLPLHFESAVFLTGFSELGYVLSKCRILDKTESDTKTRNHAAPILFGCFGTIFGIVASYFNGWTDIRTHVFGEFPVLLIVSSVGFSLTAAMVSMLIGRCRWLEYLGKHSIAILVMHKFPVMFFKLLVPEIQGILNNARSILGFTAGLAITAFSIASCLLCERILQAIFPRVLGVGLKKINHGKILR